MPQQLWVGIIHFAVTKVELGDGFRSQSIRSEFDELDQGESSKMTEGKVWSIGFKEEAGYIVGRRPLDGDPSKIEYLDTTPDKGSNPTFKSGRKHAGRAIKSDNVPTKVEWSDNKIPPYDFFMLSGMILVSDAAKEIIENSEPSLHQFFPVEVVYTDGSHARQMYFFNICARLDAMDRNRATAELKRNITWDPRTGDFIFSKALIGDHHAWIDKHVHPGRFLSDQLKSALQKAEVTGISFNPFPAF